MLLKPFLPDQIWVAEMEFHPPGMDLGARMTVVRLAEGSLFIHSPIELTPELKREIDSKGVVRYVASPFRMHAAHLAEFAQAYPDAKLYAPSGLKPKKSVEGLTFAGTLGDTPEPEWTADFEQVGYRGNTLLNEVVFYHKPSRTLILTDLCFNVPSGRGWSTDLLAGLLGVRDRMYPSKTIRIMTKDRQASRDSIQRILAWDFDRVILSHGNLVETGGKAAFREAFRWLLTE